VLSHVCMFVLCVCTARDGICHHMIVRMRVRACVSCACQCVHVPSCACQYCHMSRSELSHVPQRALTCPPNGVISLSGHSIWHFKFFPKWVHAGAALI